MSENKKRKSMKKILVILLASFFICLCLGSAFATVLAVQSRGSKSEEVGPIPQPNNSITASTIDKVVKLICIPQGGYVYDVAWSPDSKILAAASTESVKLWDSVTGNNLHIFPQSAIRTLEFSQDGNMLVSRGDTGIYVWNVTDKVELINLPINRLIGLPKASISPDSQILAYNFNNQVFLLELPGGNLADTLDYSSKIRDLAFFPNGSLLIAVIEEKPDRSVITTYTTYDIKSKQELNKFERPFFVDIMNLSPDGKKLAIAENDLYVVDLENGEEIRSFTDFRFGIPGFGFSPDGSVIAAGEGRGFEVASPSKLRLFDVTTGYEVPMLEGHEGVILEVAFSPDGRFLATASEDKTVCLWGIPPVD